MRKSPDNVNTKYVQIPVLLKYLGGFCEFNLSLNWWANCVIINSTGVRTLTITDKKLCSSCNFINSNANCYNNWNQVLKKQLTGKNINQK